MINANLSPILVRILVILTFGLTCSSMTIRAAEGPLTGAAAQARMEAARDEVANVRSNIFLTLVELDRVRGETDPQRPRFQAFTNQLAVMEGLCKAFAKHAEEMKQRGAAYFTDWEARTAAIQNPEARQKALKGYDERKESYDAINRFMQDARHNCLSFIDDLTNIKTILVGEHDPKSIARAKDLFMHANWRCIDTQRALMGMEEEFDRLAQSFARDASTGER